MIQTAPLPTETLVKQFVESPQGVKVHELQRLSSAHHRIVDLALEGLTRNEIACQMDRSPEGVGIILNSPLVQAELARRRGTQQAQHSAMVNGHLQKAREILEAAAVPAAETLVQLLEEADPNIRRLTAKDIFSQVYGTEGVVKTQVTNITVEQMTLLIQTMKEVRPVQQLPAQESSINSSGGQ